MDFKVALPILGFDEIKSFNLEKVDDNFYTLKSDEVTFTLVNPFLLRNDYEFEISENEQNVLEINDKTEFLVLNIMIVKTPFENSTVNFAAPLIFNMDKHILGQVILEKYNYGLTEPLNKYIKNGQ